MHWGKNTETKVPVDLVLLGKERTGDWTSKWSPWKLTETSFQVPESCVDVTKGELALQQDMGCPHGYRLWARPGCSRRVSCWVCRLGRTALGQAPATWLPSPKARGGRSHYSGHWSEVLGRGGPSGNDCDHP